MKYKTVELSGLALEFTAHKAMGTFDDEAIGITGITLADYVSAGGGFGLDWETCGAAIDHERISLLPEHRGGDWDACIKGMNTYDGWEGMHDASGPTAIIAAMRCLVLAKLGAEVDL